MTQANEHRPGPSVASTAKIRTDFPASSGPTGVIAWPISTAPAGPRCPEPWRMP